MKKTLLPALLAVLFSSLVVADDLVVIAHPNSNIKQLTHSNLVNLYLGRTKKLPSGVTALPLDWPADSEQKKNFYQKLVKKPLTEIHAYWARLLFTGQATPPLQINDITELLKMIDHNPGAIAYINRKYINQSVIVVYDFNKADLP